MARIGRYLLGISLLLCAFSAQAQVSQKPLPGQDLNNVWTGTNAFKQINATLYASQFATGGIGTSGSPWTSASGTGGIQEAITAAGCGGHVFMPSGYYAITNISAAQDILISLPGACTGGFELNGEGGEQTILQVSASVPSTEDVIRILSTGTQYGFYLHDFYIQPVSGSPARYGINFDVTSNSLAHVTVDRVRIGSVGNTLSNYAIFVTNPTPICNPLYLTTFMDNTFIGGVSLNNLGDSILFMRNNVTGPRDLILQNVGIVCHGAGGSHGLQVIANNLSPTGGIIVKNSWQGLFAYNDTEQVATSTEANNALLDIQGTSGNATENFIVEGNYLGANSLLVADSVRIDQCYHCQIRNNLIDRGSGVTYRVTANAIRTEITGNTQNPNGELITTWLADLGTATTVDYLQANNAARIMTNAGFGANNATTPSYYFTGGQARAGSGFAWGWASGSDPSSAGLDTGLTRTGAGVVAIGNGNPSDASGTLKACAFAITNSWESCAAPTIVAGGCGGSAAAIQNANGTASFNIFTGTAPTSGGCTITMPAATTNWHCEANHTSAISTTNFLIQQTGALSTTSVTLQLFSDVAAATAPTASDTWRTSCTAN